MSQNQTGGQFNSDSEFRNHSQNHFLGGAIQLKFRKWFRKRFRDGNLGQNAERTCPNCQFRNSSQNHSQTAHFGMILRMILRIILRRVFGTIGSWDMRWNAESRKRFRNGSIELLTESYSQIVVPENESQNNSQNYSENRFWNRYWIDLPYCG